MKLKKQPKLFNKIADVELPESIQHFRGGPQHTYRIGYQNLPSSAYMRWPSGKPCLAINMYLVDNGHNWTGQTAVATAAKLTELVRYCAQGRAGEGPCSFRDLTDDDIARLVEKLCTDVNTDSRGHRLRNNNTVRAIMQTTLSFLVWYQDNLHCGGRRLVGTRSDGAAIVVSRKHNRHSDRYYWHHRYLPPSESTEPKLPIGTTMIEDLESVIDELYDASAYPKASCRRFGKDEELFHEYRKYITARRDFMVLMMRKTGLRPEEMARMPLTENQNSLNEAQPVLTLPTLKRRKLTAPLRQFPVTPKLATRACLYLKAREAWLLCCKERNPELVNSGSMFLSTEPGKYGAPIAKSGLEKDFKNLSIRAGYRNHQACFSMFRHRFITDLVILHLKEMRKGRTEMSKHDYRIALEKVREKTGHKSIESLWHYIDLAYEVGQVWDPVNKAVRRLEASEELRYELNELRRELKDHRALRMDSDSVIELVARRLNQIIGDAEQAEIPVPNH